MNGAQESLKLEYALPAILPTGTEKEKIPRGYCQCGCGGVTPRYTKTKKEAGVKRGDPALYIPGHNRRRFSWMNTVVTAEPPNPGGFCMCGCGGKTEIAPQTQVSKGWVKDTPKKWILGHQMIGKSGVLSNGWQGGIKHSQGYIHVYRPDHHRADAAGYVPEHILVAESALGKPLPAKAQVHHADEVRSNNRPGNLVICQDDAYHKMLHNRMRAIKNGYPPHYRKCHVCKQYDDPAKLHKHGLGHYHDGCMVTYNKSNKQRRRDNERLN